MKIDDFNKQQIKSGNMINGPQTLNIIVNSFEFDDNLSGARKAQDLLSIKWMGDKPEEKQLFLKTWINITTSLKDSYFSQEGLRDILANCVKDSKDLHHEYKCYKCVDSGTQCDACEALFCNTCDVGATE